jgi:hypothetical protein
MKLLLTGATGFAGSEVLQQAIDDPAIERVTVLTRRPLGFAHAKLNELRLDDFLDYARVPLRDHDACVWCLGVSQASVSEAAYIQITYDYAVAAATAMFAANPRTEPRAVQADQRPHRATAGRDQPERLRVPARLHPADGAAQAVRLRRAAARADRQSSDSRGRHAAARDAIGPQQPRYGR